MTGRRLAYVLLVAVMAVDYAILVFWGGGRLGAESAGLAPFDLRPAGYSLAEAQAFLTALTPAGRALYLGPIRLLDTIFPLTCGLALAIGLWQRGLGLAPWLRALLTLLAAVYCALDLGENAAVATLLRTGPEALTPQAVALASGLTVGKFVASGLALLALLVLLIRRRPATAI